MKRIALKQDYFAMVDDEDFEWLSEYKWYVNKRPHTCYAITNVKTGSNKRTMATMHRLILGLGRGRKQECDHIDGNGLNNQKSNLRICSRQQNQRNKKSMKYSSSKYKGVYWDKRFRRWTSQICIDGKLARLGYFHNEQQAAKAYDKTALAEFGKFARTNFPRKNYVDTDLLFVKQILKQRRGKQTSRFKGVCWDEKSKKWRVRICINGKRTHLGYFKNEKDASEAYKRKSRQTKAGGT